jgi:hypothetical protein
MCMIISRLILFGMRNVSDKICRENQNKFYVQKHFFFRNFALYEVMWKIMVEPERPEMTI